MAVMQLRQALRAAMTEEMERDPNVFLSAVQVGVTVAGFFSSAFGAATIAPYLSRWLVRQGMPDLVPSRRVRLGRVASLWRCKIRLGLGSR